MTNPYISFSRRNDILQSSNILYFTACHAMHSKQSSMLDDRGLYFDEIIFPDKRTYFSRLKYKCILQMYIFMYISTVYLFVQYYSVFVDKLA